MDKLIDRWADYLLKAEDNIDFSKRLQETPKKIFFISMKDDVTILDFVNRFGLSNKEELKKIIIDQTYVTDEDRILSFRYTHSEIDFLHFLYNEFSYHVETLQYDAADNLSRILYRNMIRNKDTNELELFLNEQPIILQNIIVKRVDGEIAGFLESSLDETNINTYTFSYVYVSPKFRKKGIAKNLIKDTLNAREYQHYKTSVLPQFLTNTFKQLGFTLETDILNQTVASKQVDTNKNIMKIVTNSHSGVDQPVLLDMIRNMDELEWRTNPEVIRTVEDKLKQIINLNEIKKRSKEEKELFHDLTDYYTGWLGLTVEHIDTSRKWTLSEYDNATFISYIKTNNRFPNFHLI